MSALSRSLMAGARMGMRPVFAAASTFLLATCADPATTVSDATAVNAAAEVRVNDLVGPWAAYVSRGFIDVIDTRTHSIVETVDPSEAFAGGGSVVSPDGRTLYVSGGGVVYAVDTRTLRQVGRAFTSNVVHLALTRDGRTLYATTYIDRVIHVIDAATMTRRADILGPPGFGGAYRAVLSNDDRYLFTADLAIGTVSVYETATNRLVRAIPVGRLTIDIAISPDGRFVYTPLRDIPAIAKISTETFSVVGMIPAPGSEPFGIDFHPDGSRFYVTNFNSNDVTVFDAISERVIAMVRVGTNPRHITLTPDGSFGYVANQNGGSVSVIRTSDNTVVTTIPVLGNPMFVGVGGALPDLASVESLGEDVAALVASGALSAGNGNALAAKLEAALRQRDAGNKAAAANQLEAFINQVEAFLRSGRLTPAQAQGLIDDARKVLAEL